MGEIEKLIYTNPEEAEKLIVNSVGVTLGQKQANIYRLTLRQNKNSGMLLQTEEAKRFAKHLRENAMDTGVFANVLEADRILASEVNTVYSERVLNGEDPAVVANDLIESIKAKPESTDEPPYWEGSYKESVANQSELQNAYNKNDINADQYQNAINELLTWQTKVDMFNDFKSDYDKIMKGQ